MKRLPDYLLIVSLIFYILACNKTKIKTIPPEGVRMGRELPVKAHANMYILLRV